MGLFQQGPHAHRAHGQGGREELTKRRIKNQPAPLPERTGAPPRIRPAAARLRPPPGAACGGAAGERPARRAAAGTNPRRSSNFACIFSL